MGKHHIVITYIIWLQIIFGIIEDQANYSSSRKEERNMIQNRRDFRTAPWYLEWFEQSILSIMVVGRMSFDFNMGGCANNNKDGRIFMLWF